MQVAAHTDRFIVAHQWWQDVAVGGSFARSLTEMNVAGIKGYNEAIITSGGISVKELNSSTMEFKKVRGLRAAGEIIDVDALTGGFNLQIAWSTAYLAASE